MKFFPIPPAATSRILVPGCTMALLGDSISARCSTNTSTQKRYESYGYATWLRILSRGYFNFPLANNFGVTGDNLTQIAARVPSVIAARPDICFVEGGTNDLGESRTFAAMQTDMSYILAQLLRAGIQVVVYHITPRDAATTTQQQVRQRFNRWLTEIGLGRADLVAAAGLPAGLLPIVVNANPYITDQSNGQWLAGYDDADDGVHPSVTGAYWMGHAAWQALAPGLPIRYDAWADYNDLYNATNNPNGNLLTAQSGLFAGSGGTITPSGGFSGSGTLAAGWTLSASQTSTTAVVCSKENPRTDGFNSGERQRLVYTTTVAGGAAEVYNMFKTTTDVAPGDTIQFEVAYELLSHSGVTAIDLQLRQDGGVTAQSAFDCSPVNQVIPNVAHRGVLRTPPMTTVANTTGATGFIQFRMNSTSGASNLDVKLAFASIRKL